jgi:hypothetical protein
LEYPKGRQDCPIRKHEEWVGTIKDIIEHSVKPTLGEFAKGYGEAMARQKFKAEQQKAMAAQEAQLRQRAARMAAMNRQRMGGVPPQQQEQQAQQQLNRQQQAQQQQPQRPPQQQQAYNPYAQEEQPSRYQQEMQRNMINEEKIAQMSMEEIDDVEAEILQGYQHGPPALSATRTGKEKETISDISE